MAKTIWLEVVTPSKLGLRKEVEYVVVPTVDGVVGVLPGHIRLMSLVRTGVLKYRVNGEQFFMAVGEGYLEVTPTKVVVLAEMAELPEAIDPAQALEEKREAEMSLRKEAVARDKQININLQMAIAKIETYKKSEMGH